MERLFRTLRADEIDCRIGAIKDNGLSLLLYKDARCDMNILDETFGAMGWQRHHSRDNANCIVSVYDIQKNEWIEKEDTGTESNTEAQKGLASDSFKRACFNWGIGRELYTAPFIWITADKCKIENRKCYDKFRVVDIDYEDGAITRLVIENETRGIDVFSYPKNAQKPGKTTSSSSDVNVQGKNEKTQQSQGKQPKEAPDGYFYCESCGNVITDFTSKGKKISQREFAANTLNRYGKQLCKECATKAKNEVPVA